MVNPGDHVSRVTVLPLDAIDLGPKIEVIGIVNFICRDHPRAERRKCVRAFTLSKLSRPILLIATFTHVVQHRISRNVIGGLCFTDVQRFVTNDYSQFDFPIQLNARFRPNDWVMRAANGTRRLLEQHGFIALFAVGLRNMQLIVQTNGQDFPNGPDAWPQPRRAGHQR